MKEEGIRCRKLLLCMLSAFTFNCYAQAVQPDSIIFKLDTVVVQEKCPVIPYGSPTFSREQIRKEASVFADPIRVLQSSANVVAVSDMQAIPNIAGDDADCILTLFDGFPLAYPYRLLGGFSLFNPLITKRIDLFDAGYSVQFGGYAPVAINVQSDLQYHSKTSAQADLSLPISSLYIDIPISDTLQWFTRCAVRSSHIGVVSVLLNEENKRRLDSFLPTMRDVQFVSSQMPAENVWSFQEGLYSSEHGMLDANDRSFSYSWQKTFIGAALIHGKEPMSLEHRISLSHDYVSLSTVLPLASVGLKQFDIDCDFSTVRVSSNYNRQLLPVLQLTTGIDFTYGTSEIRLKTFSEWLNKKSPVQSYVKNLAGFGELQWLITDHLQTTIGLRGSYFALLQCGAFEPRVSVHFAPSSRFQIDCALGQYAQAPSDFQVLYGFLAFLAISTQTPRMMLISEKKNEVKPEVHSLASVRISNQLISSSNLSLTLQTSGYAKYTESLLMPSRYPAFFTPLDTMSFEPMQCFHGIKFGAGVSTILQFIPLHCSLAGSFFYHRNRIIDERDDREYRTAGDIPFSAKIIFQYNVQQWNLGLLYHYSIGIPTTEQIFVETTTIGGGNTIIPVAVWKELNTSRLPDFHRLDLYAEWKICNTPLKLNASVNIANLLSNKNLSGYKFIYTPNSQDNVSKEPVCNTLPFLPTVGIHCEYTFQ